jgi:hypothetical protein
MSTRFPLRRRAAASLGVAGSALGVVAGIVQALAGVRIPEWTGAKQAPGSLGLLTIVLSLLAGYAAYRQVRPRIHVGPRAAYAAALLIPGLLCFSTVGRLWYLPGPLLLAAAVLSIDSLRDTGRLITRNWLRCLLALLGVAELLMAAGASPVPLVVGAVGGAALMAAATISRSRATLMALVMLGTVPFAALAWTAVVPVVLLLAAAGISVPLTRRPLIEPVTHPYSR